MYATSLGFMPYLPISDRIESKFAPVSASEEPDASRSATFAESRARNEPAPSVPAPPTIPAKEELPSKIAWSIAFACARARAEVIIGRTLITTCSSVSFAMKVPETSLKACNNTRLTL